MKTCDAALRRYYWQVRQYIPGAPRLKKNVLEEIKGSVALYRVENPNADFAQIQAHFGTPLQIAAAYVENLGTAELLNRLRAQRRITRIVAGAMSAALILWAVGVTTVVIHDLHNNPAFVVEEIGEYPPGYVVVDECGGE